MKRVLAACLVFVSAGCPGSPHRDGGTDALDALADTPSESTLDAVDAGRGHTVSIDTPVGTLSVAENGTVALVGSDGLPIVDNATADVLLSLAGHSTVVSAHACAVAHLDASMVPSQADTDLGGARDTIVMRCEPTADVGLDLYLQSHAGSTALTARLDVRAHNALQLLRASPLSITPGIGGFYVAGSVSDDRILDDGSMLIGDFTVRLASGDHARELFASIIPIPIRGNVIANTNLGLQDLGTGRGVSAGFLTNQHGFALVGLGASSTHARVRADGAGAYDTVAADVVYLPNGKPIAAGGEFWSETLDLDVGAPDGLTAMEHYADSVAAVQHITPWHARSTTTGGPEGRHVPSAWQSWCLGFMGGYAHDIDESIVHMNVDAAARDLLPYGFDVVPIDDGWQVAWGDWTPQIDRFPDGLAGESGYARANGLGGGFWIAPFGADPMSQLATAHPDWIAMPEPTLGPIFINANTRVLDLSRDDVIAFVRQTAHDMNAAVLAWSKQDFAYRALGTVPSDPNYTAVEAYRRGFAAVRSETPDTTLLAVVAIFGPNFGVADAIRTGLDNGGRWDELPTDPDSVTANTRAFKTTVRTATRRWYLNDRVVLLDPDAIPFRSMDTPATIGDTEERTFALYLAMLGGVIELGDPIVGMRPFAQDTFRRMIPAYGRTARPLDVFVRDYNERFVLPVNAWSRDANAPAPWALLGAMNWGRNRDLSSNPPTAMPDAMRHFRFTRSEIGLGAGPLVAWELWSGQIVATTGDAIEIDVAAHDSAAVVVRPFRAGVQLLGTDRHVTGGAPDVIAEAWDAASKTFTLRFRAVAAGSGGRTTTVHVAVRADDAVTGTPAVMLSGTSAPDLAVMRNGALITVTLTPASSGDATLSLVFPP